MELKGRYILITLIMLLATASMSGMSISFSGVLHNVISETPEKKTGLDKIYVVYDIKEVSAIEITGVDGSLEATRYSNLGGGFAEPVALRWDGTTACIDRPSGDMGYIFKDNGETYYIWVVDYSKHRYTLSSIVAEDIQECDNTRFTVVGECGPITYYTIDGRAEELSREIRVSYMQLSWDESNHDYSREEQTKIESSLGGHLTLSPALYCASEIRITGDRFLEEWGEAKTVTTGTIEPNGLEAHTTAEQTNVDDSEGDEEHLSNVISGEGSGLGGSAPAVILFTAYTTDAVIHHEWQMTRDPQFDNIEYRFNDQEIEYTFNEEGEYYIRYVGSNSDGSCEVYGDTYTVSIGSSELRIPNAFSPNDDGVNDVWKVGYRSLISFKCWIMDRYGNQLYYFDDPNGGWDGKYHGKTVKGGVYFYVIEAKGADGKKYKKGGDINIVTRKKGSTGVAEQ